MIQHVDLSDGELSFLLKIVSTDINGLSFQSCRFYQHSFLYAANIVMSYGVQLGD